MDFDARRINISLNYDFIKKFVRDGLRLNFDEREEGDELLEHQKNQRGDSSEIEEFEKGNMSVEKRLERLEKFLAERKDWIFFDIDEEVDREELLWERDEWLCGPETWKLLLSHKFDIWTYEERLGTLKRRLTKAKSALK